MTSATATTAENDVIRSATIELRITVEQAKHGATDLVVEADRATTILVLAQELARHFDQPESDATLYSERLRSVLDGAEPIAARMLDGDRVTISTGRHRRPVPDAGDADDRGLTVATLAVTAGPSSGLRVPLAEGTYVVGRDDTCDITIDDRSISRRHLTVEVTAAGVTVTDEGSSNGTAIDGTALAANTPRELRGEDQVELGRTLLSVERRPASQGGLPSGHDGRLIFNRPPRVAKPFAPVRIRLGPPPSDPHRTQLQVGAALMPLLMGVAFAVIVKQPAMLLFSALTPVMAVWTYVADRRAGRRGFRSGVAAFRDRLEKAEPELVAARNGEIAARRQESPDAAELLERAELHLPTLWERRPTDADYLKLRVGVADQPALSGLDVGETGNEKLAADARELAARFATAPAVPATVSLGAAGVLGLCGDRNRVDSSARWLALQLAALHSPRDVLLCAAISPERRAAWDWLKWLPHASQDPSPLDGPQLADGTLSTRRLLRELSSVLAARRQQAEERYTPGATLTLPTIVTFIDGAVAADRALMVELMTAGPALGMHTVWLGEDPRDLPGECRDLVSFEAERARATLTDIATGGALADIAADGLALDVADRAARGLAPVRDTGASGTRAEVPRRVSLLEVLDLQDLRPETVLERWRHTGTGRSAPIGVEAGVPFCIDLRTDGPHALVAGTTGAGKSELLQSMVAALAAEHPPSRLSFLLVDYKGGAAFKDCADLPHTAGMVTDLDGHLAQRALSSLNAELRRREAVLRTSGARDLSEMERRDPGAPASLVIVIDEFATLAKEIPEFVDGVVDVAQRGRSLGVHLVLATQRPSGVVSENIRANTNLKIALRVASAAESDDVISSREAARIPRSIPGRAYARTGHSELTMFQAAYGGSPLSHAAQRQVSIADFSFASADEAPARKTTASEPSDQTELQALAATIAAAAHDGQFEPAPSPWLPELPELLAIEDLADTTPPAEGVALIGLIDEPARQRQTPLLLDLTTDGSALIFGASGSGKTSLLQTIAASLASRCAPRDLHIYGLDFASRALTTIEALPHCGTVVPGDDAERVRRLITNLRRTIEHRKSALAAAGLSSFEEQRRRNPDDYLPRLVLLLDSYSGFTAAYERVDLGSLLDMLTRIIADGRAVGVHVVATADRRGAVPASVTGVVQRRLVLRMADEDDYSALGLDVRTVRGARLPPGRGFTSSSLEFQTALPAGSTTGEGLEALAAALKAEYGSDAAPEIKSLPTSVARAELPVADGELTATFAIADDDFGPVTVSIRDTHLFIAGPYRSGRTSALESIAGGLRDATPGLELHALLPRRRSTSGFDGYTSAARGAEQCRELAARLAAITTERAASDVRSPLVVIIDDGSELSDGPVANDLETIVRRGRDVGVRVVMAIEVQTARSAFAPWIKEVRKDGYGLLLSPNADMDGDLLGVRLPRTSTTAFPAGRGYLVDSAIVRLVQVSR